MIKGLIILLMLGIALFVGHEWLTEPKPPLWAHLVFWGSTVVFGVLSFQELYKNR